MRALLLLSLMVAGCGDPDPFGEFDASYPFDRDSGLVPAYRDACPGGGGSGIGGSGSGSGIGGSGIPCPGMDPDAGVDGGFDAGPPPPPCNEHTFRYAEGATTVWVTGTFTSWAATPAEGAIEMELVGPVWEATVLVEPPGRHEYKLIIDGMRWIDDPMNPERVPDGFGGFNSVLHLCGAACGDLAEFDWRDAVMYFVMVDRFRDSDGRAMPVAGATDGDARTGPSGQYEGGDLAGVTERMSYLADLGVTAIWLSAPYDNRDTAGEAIDPRADMHLYSAYHGYWPSPANVSWGAGGPTPRPRVEPRIGSESDLRAVIASAHDAMSANGHGIKVLFDYVMHHVDTASALYSAHNDWFARRGDGSFALCGPEGLWDDPYWGTRCAFTPYLAPFDMENPAPRAWSVEDALWWAREYEIDGYRLDAIKHEPLVWLTDLRTRLTGGIPDPDGGRFYLVGETFAYDDRDLLRRFVDPETMLDGQFDFPFKARLCEATLTGSMGMDAFAGWMDGNDGFYGPGSIMTTWIGNHDIPRAIHFASRQIGNCREGSSPGNGWNGAAFRQPTDAAPYERLGVAFAVMMTNPGIPLVYYGDEVGLAGGGDPDNRRMMPWTDAELNEHQRALRDRVRALARVRGENPLLARGARVTVSADADSWVYRRIGCEGASEILVAINRADMPRMVSIPAGDWEDLIGAADTAGGSVMLAPRSFLVLRAR